MSAYRFNGHLKGAAILAAFVRRADCSCSLSANLNPLEDGKHQREVPQLDPQRYGLGDPSAVFALDGVLSLPGNPAEATFADIQCVTLCPALSCMF